jgi:hypothetical protein
MVKYYCDKCGKEARGPTIDLAGSAYLAADAPILGPRDSCLTQSIEFHLEVTSSTGKREICRDCWIDIVSTILAAHTSCAKGRGLTDG